MCFISSFLPDDPHFDNLPKQDAVTGFWFKSWVVFWRRWSKLQDREKCPAENNEECPKTNAVAWHSKCNQKVTSSLSVWQPKKHSFKTSLVLWHYVTAWGFFFILSPCNTPKQQMPKRPKLRINQGIWGDKDGSECCPDLRAVREGRHD